MFYLQCITRKCAKEKKQQYLMLYQTWNRTPVYFKLAVSASYTFDAEIQYIAIGCQMGRNFQILTWTACANIATQTISHLRFSTARLLWPNGWSTDSSSPWSRIELPRDKSLDYLTVAIVSINCWLFLWLLLSFADCFPAPLNLFLSSTHVLFLGHENNQ